MPRKSRENFGRADFVERASSVEPLLQAKFLGEGDLHDPAYDHTAFRPWRLMALAFKALRNVQPDYEIWRDFPYEYETDRPAIDVINGGPRLRQWVDNAGASPEELDAEAASDERSWIEERARFLLY